MRIQFHLIFDHHYDLKSIEFDEKKKKIPKNYKPICRIRSSTICLYELPAISGWRNARNSSILSSLSPPTSASVQRNRILTNSLWTKTTLHLYSSRQIQILTIIIKWSLNEIECISFFNIRWIHFMKFYIQREIFMPSYFTYETKQKIQI